MASDPLSFIHLARPFAPGLIGAQPTTAPLNVVVFPQAIFSILDHAIRRDIRDTQSTRVIGALLGVRSEDGLEIEVRNCFAIPHTENEDQVEVDIEYQKNMLSLQLKANPREVLLGWYTTSLELNSFSALIQNFFASSETGTFPHPAVHLTVSTEAGKPITARAYTSAPVGVNAERAAESCLFIPVPHEIRYSEAEKSGLELISKAKDSENRSAPVITDIEGLETAVDYTLDLLDRVSEYVSNVIDEEREPSNALGQFLKNALSMAPKVDPQDVERDFNNHIQDILVVSFLTNTIRTQVELSQRLATATLSMGGSDNFITSGGGDSGDSKVGQRNVTRFVKRGGGRGLGQHREPRESQE
ncbi:Eukaryotic translation initiation factor 3 subunit F [Erysiphe necator]|uniref:Eukaryotic translation initiation factor 3 subunit F n=1 Tax=Uncinula necator TaxID=52586 RepID=A0A0B1P2D1_UNCNE|nr:Eukaryotic translation initiation factor 3 subunit F [Erysiphe necator]KHJ32453.1 putative eukaryotic translation initiation factor 3 subunit f protein [Erysiphe necator]